MVPLHRREIGTRTCPSHCTGYILVEDRIVLVVHEPGQREPDRLVVGPLPAGRGWALLVVPWKRGVSWVSCMDQSCTAESHMGCERPCSPQFGRNHRRAQVGLQSASRHDHVPQLERGYTAHGGGCRVAAMYTIHDTRSTIGPAALYHGRTAPAEQQPGH